MRVAAFIDGFNLYHALNDLNKPHLKWLDLRKLCGHFAPKPDNTITGIYYFSAYATWKSPGVVARHRAYVSALTATGVEVILGSFKEKQMRCPNCGGTYKSHEEKQTDVNLALYLVKKADTYDRALLVSGDSDFSSTVELIRIIPKDVRIISPQGRKHSFDLVRAAGGKEHCRQLRELQIEHALLPREIKDQDGRDVIRPHEYDPPKQD